VSKKTEKPIKSKKLEKKTKPLKKTGKILSQTEKPSLTKKTKPNQFEPVFVQKNRTETGRFEPVSVLFWFCFFFKIVWLFF
jgi:hypothetical protein